MHWRLFYVIATLKLIGIYQEHVFPICTLAADSDNTVFTEALWVL